MRVEWYGQSAFGLTGRDTTVFIDPFGDTSGLAARGIQFEYPPIEGVSADLLLITHEHHDHNGADAIGGDPHGGPPVDLAAAGHACRRADRDRLRARPGGRHAARPEHDLRLRARRPVGLPLRRLRPVGAARRAGGGDRLRRPALPARRGRPDDRRRAGRRDRRVAGAPLGGADALPHAADRLPRDGRRVPRAHAGRSTAWRARRSRRATCPRPSGRWRWSRRRPRRYPRNRGRHRRSPGREPAPYPA